MKKETRLKKLAALLGIEEVAEAHIEKKKGRPPKFTEVPEETIDEFRAAQGLLYFLRAPELFTPKVCRHCETSFLVSRQYVAYCSYTCIRKSFEEEGIYWKKGEDLEALARDPDVYNGNEPIWITNLDRINEVLQKALSGEGIIPATEPKPKPPVEPVKEESLTEWNPFG